MNIEVTDVFDKWLKDLRDLQAKERILARIIRLRDGNRGDDKALAGTGGIRELRIKYGPGYRLYYIQRGKTLILLLCGGDKSSQKKDIATAVALVKRSAS